MPASTRPPAPPLLIVGLIARAFDLRSRLGALLDSAADTLLLFAACYGVWVFHPGVLTDHLRSVLVVVVGNAIVVTVGSTS